MKGGIHIDRNKAFDAFRFIGCIGVILIHVRIPGFMGQYLALIARFAVPFFIMLSGYYCDKQSIAKRTRKTLRLALFCFVFYSISNSVICLIQGKSILIWLTSRLHIGTFIRFVLLNRAHFFANIAYYPMMMLYVYVIYGLLCRMGIESIGVILTPFLIVLNLVLQYAGVEWYYSGNWLLTGIPFFFCGKWLSSSSIRCKFPVLLIITSTVLIFIESYFIPHDLYLSIGSLLLSLSVMLFCRQYPTAMSSFSSLGERLSMPIFLLHCFVRDIVELLFIPEPLNVFVVVFLSVLLSIIVSSTRQKIYFPKRTQ